MKKTILQILQAVAAEMNLPQPQVVIGATDQTVNKLLALTRAICDDLLSEFNWEALHKRYTFTTTNGVDGYSTPSDFERFVPNTFFNVSTRSAMRGPLTPTQWEAIKTTNIAASPFTNFRVFGEKVYLYPTPGTTSYNYVYEYISNNYVLDSGGTPKSDFTADSDVCVFDHRVIFYGLKLKWLASIGQETTAALMDFQRAKEFAKASDTPAPKLSMSGVVAHPFITTNNIADGSWVI